MYSAATGFARDVESNDAGEYKIPLVPVGVYTVSAQKEGFQTQKFQGVHVEILSANAENFALKVRATDQVVDVSASNVQLNTETSEAGTVIKGAEINSLPSSNTDFQLFKVTPLHESQTVEFRSEMYNAFNHTQWSAPSVNMESPATFGVITGTAAPRIMQFAVKYSFQQRQGKAQAL